MDLGVDRDRKRVLGLYGARVLTAVEQHVDDQLSVDLQRTHVLTGWEAGRVKDPSIEGHGS